MKTNKHRASGFTIVELLISVAIIGILISVSIIAYNGVQDNARRVSLMSDLDNAVSVLERDLAKNGSYPATVGDADGGDGLDANPNTTYQYTVNNTNNPKLFCLTATNGNERRSVDQEGRSQVGACPTLRYDAGVASSYPGMGTTVADLSAKGINGTLLNGLAFSNKNFVFDGVDDRIETAINQPYGNNTTWSAWVKCTQNMNAYNMFMGKSLPYFAVRFCTTMFFSNSISGVQRSVAAPATMSIGNWYHGVFTTRYDGANTTMSIYVDGVNKVSTSWAGSQYNVTNKFIIGDGRPVAPWYPFKGMVSDVRVYDYAMTENEIRLLFEEQRGRYGV